MKDWRNAVIKPTATIRNAIEVLDREALQIVLVVDEAFHLLGTLTDGDVRRGLLRGLGLDAPVNAVMNASPITAGPQIPREQIVAMMTQRGIRQCPIVAADGGLQSVFFLDELIRARSFDNPVVLMAGGLGSRLAPLTNDCPKPLLKVGGKPILRIILEAFIEQGFHRFFISLNYRADMIKEHLGDGTLRHVEIHYLEEQQKLGTAGALNLLPEIPSCPLIVMNGDLLTKVSFPQMLEHHRAEGCAATMAVGEYDFQVPFGVVEVADFVVRRIIEKPVHRFFVNAGIYCLDPMALGHLGNDGYLDMPTLFQRLMDANLKVSCFPIREYWLDIGRMQDFERANQEYSEYFGSR